MTRTAASFGQRHPAGVVGDRPPRRLTRSLLVLRRAVVVLAGLLSSATFANEVDPSRTRASDDGVFVVAIKSQVEPVPLNALHAWVVHVETAQGEPVEGARFEIGGGMPMHDHGLPTAPRITEELGGGDYLLEGVKFQMPGHWTLSFDISGGGTEDSVTFELML